MAKSQKRVRFADDLNKMDKQIEDVDRGHNRENVPEQGFNGLKEGGREGFDFFPKRLQWTTDMVKLLITAFSCAIRSASLDLDVAGRTALPDLPREVIVSKWKDVSELMVGRGHVVSPRQCENKFKCLYRKYKRLNEILGEGTSCSVVEDLKLLEKLEIPVGAREEVRRLLDSKHLFYQEMCLFHKSNCPPLPRDWATHRSSQMALKGKYCIGHHEVKSNEPYNAEKLDEDGKGNDLFRAKRQKELGHEAESFTHVSKTKQSVPPVSDCANATQWMLSLSEHLRKIELSIREQTLVFKQKRLELLIRNKEEDKKLNEIRLENEHMRLENMRLEVEIKRREMCGKSVKA